MSTYLDLLYFLATFFQADLVQFIPPEFAEVEGVDVGADEAGAAVFEN